MKDEESFADALRKAMADLESADKVEEKEEREDERADPFMTESEMAEHDAKVMVEMGIATARTMDGIIAEVGTFELPDESGDVTVHEAKEDDKPKKVDSKEADKLAKKFFKPKPTHEEDVAAAVTAIMKKKDIAVHDSVEFDINLRKGAVDLQLDLGASKASRKAMRLMAYARMEAVGSREVDLKRLNKYLPGALTINRVTGNKLLDLYCILRLNSLGFEKLAHLPTYKYNDISYLMDIRSGSAFDIALSGAITVAIGTIKEKDKSSRRQWTNIGDDYYYEVVKEIAKQTAELHTDTTDGIETTYIPKHFMNIFREVVSNNLLSSTKSLTSDSLDEVCDKAQEDLFKEMYPDSSPPKEEDERMARAFVYKFMTHGLEYVKKETYRTVVPRHDRVYTVPIAGRHSSRYGMSCTDRPSVGSTIANLVSRTKAHIRDLVFDLVFNDESWAQLAGMDDTDKKTPSPLKSTPDAYTFMTNPHLLPEIVKRMDDEARVKRKRMPWLRKPTHEDAANRWFHLIAARVVESFLVQNREMIPDLISFYGMCILSNLIFHRVRDDYIHANPTAEEIEADGGKEKADFRRLRERKSERLEHGKHKCLFDLGYENFYAFAKHVMETLGAVINVEELLSEPGGAGSELSETMSEKVKKGSPELDSAMAKPPEPKEEGEGDGGDVDYEDIDFDGVAEPPPTEFDEEDFMDIDHEDLAKDPDTEEDDEKITSAMELSRRHARSMRSKSTPGPYIGDSPPGKMTIQEGAMERSLPGHMIGRAWRPSPYGNIVRSTHRWAVDRWVFTERMKGKGVTILMDVSGSMSIGPNDVKQIIELAPATTFAIYGAGYTEGQLRILAKNGRCVDLDNRDAIMPRDYCWGANVVDVPALQWLNRMPKPRIWVCDGGVTGIEDNLSYVVNSLCLAELNKRSILTARNINEAIELTKAMVVGCPSREALDMVMKD